MGKLAVRVPNSQVALDIENSRAQLCSAGRRSTLFTSTPPGSGAFGCGMASSDDDIWDASDFGVSSSASFRAAVGVPRASSSSVSDATVPVKVKPQQPKQPKQPQQPSGPTAGAPPRADTVVAPAAAPARPPASPRRSTTPPAPSTELRAPRPRSITSYPFLDGKPILSLDTTSNVPPGDRRRNASPFPEATIDARILHRLRRYILCFANVEFDIDLGVDVDLDRANPELSEVYPPTRFPKSLRSNIAFSSLPEGEDQLPTAGAHTFSWRIPIPRRPTSTTAISSSDASVSDQIVEDPFLASLTNTEATSSQSTLASSRLSSDVGHSGPDGQDEDLGGQLGSRSDGHLHGFVYFLQEKDDLARRGYTQRSLVLITHRPSLVGLFSSTISTLGPLHFKYSSQGGGMVETACYNIAAWPDLVPGATLDYPFLGVVHSVSIPIDSQPQWLKSLPSASSKSSQLKSPSVGGPVPIIPASSPLTPLSVALHDTLSFSKILLLWELVLLGDPILISTSDPRTGSELVHHLRNLIRPILFAGDYRPYFHIHDTDFARIASPTKPIPGSILSSTNPLILTQLKNRPHILRTHIGKTESTSTAAIGLTSTRKRHVKKDPVVAKLVETAFKNGDYVTCDALIFKHLAALTESFIAPLNRYFASTSTSAAAGGANASQGSTVPQGHARSLSSTISSMPSTSASFPTFTPSSFLASLKAHGTPLPFRAPTTSTLSSTIERFYSRFLTSPNFASWLHHRADLTGEAVKSRWLDKVENADLDEWRKGKNQQEVDLLVERLQKEVVGPSFPPWIISERLEHQRSISSSPLAQNRNPPWGYPQTQTSTSVSSSPSRSPLPSYSFGTSPTNGSGSRSEKLRNQVEVLKSPI
ncbi:BQ2448_7236 [Microbotryum intermedium]|uniref:BQ2448_7236 protein n=1 Tax=Microbotryum intermedium TaxID=269621 RepID=A0A238FHL5_9BASI|nr:BQ2448_7236 [Microbotryum intermedium]